MGWAIKFKVALNSVNAIFPSFGERDREERARHGTGEDAGVCTVGAALVQPRGLEQQLGWTVAIEIISSNGRMDVTWNAWAVK